MLARESTGSRFGRRVCPERPIKRGCFLRTFRVLSIGWHPGNDGFCAALTAGHSLLTKNLKLRRQADVFGITESHHGLFSRPSDQS